jgi:hypothetical protein
MNPIGSEVLKSSPTRQVEVDALKHLIHKFRWMGLEEEAESACARLSRLSPTATAFSGPHDTD